MRILSVVLAMSLALAGCASVPVRTLPLSEVQGWRIAEVKVAFAPNAVVELPASLNAYVQREIKKEAPGLDNLPIDPANPGRNAYAEKAMEIAARPEARAHVLIEGSETIRRHFMQGFQTQPAGPRPVRLELLVTTYVANGGETTIATGTRFVDARTGGPLLEGPAIVEQRRQRTAVATSVAGLIAVAVVATVITAIENQNGGVLDSAAAKLRLWLLAKEERDTQ